MKVFPFTDYKPIVFTQEVIQQTYEIEQDRYNVLFQKLSKEALILALHLAVAQYLFPEFYHMLKGLTGQAVTMALALELTGESSTYTLSELKKQYHILRKYLRLEQKMENFYTVSFIQTRDLFYICRETMPCLIV